MSRANAGWLFYKKSFFHLDENSKTLNDKHLKNINDALLKKQFKKNTVYQNSIHGFELKTTYPGLIVGSGYSHNAKNSKENFQLGLFFDYTTGYPVIAGSSVKGIVRSFFKRLKNEDEKDLVLEYFQETFKEIGFDEVVDEGFLSILENEIFEGVDNNGEHIATYERDIFLDAFINCSLNDGERIFGDDYITPHDNPLLEPNPNRFLKILPEVSFRFNFDLKNSKTTKITAEQKELLFLKLLLFSGVGAKTNVGYGQFEDWSEEDIKKFKNEKKQIKRREQRKALDDGFEKLKLRLEDMKKPQSIHNAVKENVNNLNENEKKEIKNIVNQKISDKNSKWYKKIEKLL